MNRAPLLDDGTEAFIVGVITVEDATGASVDADALPEVTLLSARNGQLPPADAALYAGVDVYWQETGVYAIRCDVATAIAGHVSGGFDLNLPLYGWVSVTVDGITRKQPITPFTLEAYRYYGVVAADAGNTATTFKFDIPDWPATNDLAKNNLIRFMTGALQGQVRKVSAMNALTPTVTVSEAFTGAPSAGDLFNFIAD